MPGLGAKEKGVPMRVCPWHGDKGFWQSLRLSQQRKMSNGRAAVTNNCSFTGRSLITWLHAYPVVTVRGRGRVRLRVTSSWLCCSELLWPQREWLWGWKGVWLGPSGPFWSLSVKKESLLPGKPSAWLGREFLAGWLHSCRAVTIW